MSKTPIQSDRAPAPVGPYSQAILARGELLFISGQIPLDPATGEFVGRGDIQTQTRQVMANLAAILQAADLDWSAVVKTSIFLTDLEDFAAVNAIYSEFFADTTPPARACVQVARLPKDAAIEIECIALAAGT